MYTDTHSILQGTFNLVGETSKPLTARVCVIQTQVSVTSRTLVGAHCPQGVCKWNRVCFGGPVTLFPFLSSYL